MSGQAETQCSQPESEPSAGAAPAAGASAPGPPPRQSPSELLGLILSLLGTLDGHDISGDLKEKLTGFKEVAKAVVEASKGPASKEQWADISSKANATMKRLDGRRKTQQAKVDKAQKALDEAKAELDKTNKEWEGASKTFCEAISHISSANAEESGAAAAGPLGKEGSGAAAGASHGAAGAGFKPEEAA